MKTLEYFNYTQTGLRLGVSRSTVADIVKSRRIETTTLGLPGRAQWLTNAQVEEIEAWLGIEIKPREPASVP